MIGNASAGSSEEVGRPRAGSASLNQPGQWDYFLCHGIGADDQVKTLCVMLQQRGKTVWYDNEMGDRSTAAMEEGVKHSAHFLIFLSGEPGQNSTDSLPIDCHPVSHFLPWQLSHLQIEREVRQICQQRSV